MKLFFRASVWLLWLIPALLLVGCGEKRVTEFSGVDTAMGTVVRLSVFASEDRSQTEGILELVKELEEKTLSRRLETAEVFQVNRTAGSGTETELSAELSHILSECEKLSQDSEGAFDVALGPLVRLWDIDGWAGGERTGIFHAPEESEREQALEQSGFGRLHFRASPGKETASVCPDQGAAIDLGAVGKGIALDGILAYLSADETVSGAVVSVGGSILTYGEKPDGAPWRVGIVNPMDTSENLGVLTLSGQTFLSTSGDYERYVEEGGVRYHHILDPATGFPADSGLRSVTVLAENGLLSDGLSTACFVLGRERGMDLAGQYGAEALFVDRDGVIYMTPGMQALFQETP